MKKKIILAALVLGVMIVVGSGGLALYLWNMPHRDVLAAEPDFTLSSDEFISEYLENQSSANNKFLSDDGDSKIVVLSGQIASISKNQNGDQVVLLKEPGAPVGVAFTFTPETNAAATALQPGQLVSIKGVVRSGPRRDEFLGIYANGVIEKASLF